MAYFFRADGTVNLKRLSLSTMCFVGLYANAFLFSVRQVGDPGMDPLLQGYSQVYEGGRPLTASERFLSFLLADKALYSKVKLMPAEHSRMQGKVVAMVNPYDKKQVIFRRVVATETLWIKRLDDGGII